MSNKKSITVTLAEYNSNINKYFDMVVKDGMTVKVIDDKGTAFSICGFPKFERKVKHQFEAHRRDPAELARLRNYYVSLNRKGHLGTIHALIEFIEAYAEQLMWDLDEYSESEQK